MKNILTFVALGLCGMQSLQAMQQSPDKEVFDLQGSPASPQMDKEHPAFSTLDYIKAEVKFIEQNIQDVRDKDICTALGINRFCLQICLNELKHTPEEPLPILPGEKQNRLSEDLINVINDRKLKNKVMTKICIALARERGLDLTVNRKMKRGKFRQFSFGVSLKEFCQLLKEVPTDQTFDEALLQARGNKGYPLPEDIKLIQERIMRIAQI